MGTSRLSQGQTHLPFPITTVERSGHGEPSTRKWRFAIHYVLAAPDTEEEVLANPAGLHITHFDRVQDLS